MVLAVSRFRVVNRMEEEVAAAFQNRPHLGERASGFLGLEVFRDRNDLRVFYLVTRWSDEESFREWHGSEAHRHSHAGIPAGLRLDPEFTEVVVLERIEEMDGAQHRIADLGLLLAPFLAQARGTLLLRCTADGTILDCNPAARDLLGPALVGRLLWECLVEADAERLKAHVAAATRRPEEQLRLNVCDPADVPHTIECHVDLCPDGFVLLGERDSGIQRLHGELLALNNELAVMARERGQALARAQRAEREHERLLASERQARVEAEEANCRKDDVLAMVSHDLRTPLGAVISWSRLLASGRLSEKEGTRAVEAIQRNAEIQAKLVEDLLDLTRAKAGKLRFNPQPTDPAKVVESILEAARPAAEAKGVSLERVVTGGPALLLLADPVRLEQALCNLVANAVKFTPAGGCVEVRLGEEGGSVAIRVQDTGEGIDPELLPYIFDRFRQGQGTGAEWACGLGLGLAIARDLIELQGGTIEAASDGPGRGTTFTVRMPCHPAPLPQDRES